VIVNPGARSARAGLRLNDIRALSPQVEMRETGGIGDASRLAEELARAGAPLIVAAGGDGTVNEVVTGIVRAGALGRTVLGVLPTGTMNVFAAELGLPAARLDECWQAITGGLAREVDLWRLNDTYFVQLAGVGFDAAIIRETSWESKKRFGPLSYLMSGWKVLGRRATVMSVQAAGREAVSGTVVLIGNGRHYGGPFPLFPHALPGDGLLDVVVMPGQGWQHFYAVGRALLSGHYAAKRGVHYFQTDQLRVDAADAVPYEVDGELAGAASVLDFSKHGRLTVMGARPGPL
jgi:YegS/Rv2252/BmrU family lipid kinase